VKARRIPVELLKPGMTLAVNIYSSDSKLLLIKKGLPLSKDLIFVLKKRNIQTVPVEEKAEDTNLTIPMPPDAKKIGGVPFTFPESIEGKIFINRGGITILKIDDPVVESTKKKAVKTAHTILHSISSGETLDIESSRSAAREIINAIAKNREAFMNIAGMRMVDEYTFVHSVNVAAYATIIARDYGISGKELELFCTGALLHDVGKMLINSAILNKPDKLSAEEWDEMKTHPLKGYEILKENGISEEMALVARGHHERCDGSGYPLGLTQDDMPDTIHITAIADVYDALTSDRAYKKAMKTNNAMMIIMAESGTHFNSEFVGIFQRLIGIYPIGVLVRLNNGSIARVLEQNEGAVRPIIQLLTDPRGKQLKDRVVINLMDNTEIFITESFVSPAAA